MVAQRCLAASMNSIGIVTLFWLIQFATADYCLEGWISHEDHCYLISKTNDEKTWEEAQLQCSQLGAVLLSIANPSETDFVTRYLLQTQVYWIGLSRQFSPPSGNLTTRRMGWQWVDGTNYVYQNWNDNQPSELYTHAVVNFYGTWSDWDANIKLQYICKRPAIPGTAPPPLTITRMPSPQTTIKQGPSGVVTSPSSTTSTSTTTTTTMRSTSKPELTPSPPSRVTILSSSVGQGTPTKTNPAVDIPTAFTPDNGNSENTYCPGGWNAFEGNCYFFSPTPDRRSWADSQSACQSLGANLMSITSLEETSVVTKYVPQGRLYWVGLIKDTASLGILSTRRLGWRWTDGSSYDWSNWDENKPSLRYRRVAVEYLGKWTDWDEGIALWFICEKRGFNITTMMPTTKLTTFSSGFSTQMPVVPGASSEGPTILTQPTPNPTSPSSSSGVGTTVKTQSQSAPTTTTSTTTTTTVLSSRSGIGTTVRTPQPPVSSTTTTSSNIGGNSGTPSPTPQTTRTPAPSGGGSVVTVPPTLSTVRLTSYMGQPPPSTTTTTTTKSQGAGSPIAGSSTPSPAGPDENANCPSGWKFYADGCYFFSPSDDKMTWSDAKDACARKDSVLASVTSQEESDFVKRYVLQGRVYWIGLIKESVSPLGDLDKRRKDWEWLDGSVYNWINWDDNKPSMRYRKAAVEYLGKWTDWDVTIKLWYICEKREKIATTPRATPAIPIGPSDTSKDVDSSATSSGSGGKGPTGQNQPQSTVSGEISAVTKAPSGKTTSRAPVPSENDNLPIYIGVGVGAGVVLILILIAVICLIKRRKRRKKEPDMKRLNKSMKVSYRQPAKDTNNFIPEDSMEYVYSEPYTSTGNLSSLSYSTNSNHMIAQKDSNKVTKVPMYAALDKRQRVTTPGYEDYDLVGVVYAVPVKTSMTRM